MVLVLTMVVLQSISFTNYALTTTTTNIIYGSAPYLTFDGGRTRVTNTESLLGISLSDGRRFTPTTNNSSFDNPIILPVDGQSFNDIGMFIPTNTDSVELSSVIGPPNNYWGDDDGDGQGTNDISATGSLSLSIVNRWNQPVARNEVLNICRGAPYKLTLSNTEGTLKTRYGVPNESRFSASNATYYIKPKASTAICFARPQSALNGGVSDAVWKFQWGFLPQSVTPSSYGLNFPTTGANNLFFYLDIVGSNQTLSWAPVSHGGITATMTDSPDYNHYYYDYSVRVTLTGPVVTDPNQWESENPDRIDRPSLPQVFELVGRDSSGNAVVKYGFELKQWFVYRGPNLYSYSSVESWCNSLGYRVPKVSDFTNASCPRGDFEIMCGGAVGATPSSPDAIFRRHIGAGFFTEWGSMDEYTGADLDYVYYWTQDRGVNNYQNFLVATHTGQINRYPNTSAVSSFYSRNFVLCVYP